jgi:hypothetical protein
VANNKADSLLSFLPALFFAYFLLRFLWKKCAYTFFQRRSARNTIVKQVEKQGSFLISCREAYLQGIRPADPNNYDRQEYKKIVDIARLYFDNNLQREFSGYMMEGQYYIDLWTAHLLFEYGQPNINLKNRCLEIIKQYASYEVVENGVASPNNYETNWLHLHLKEAQ